MTVSIAPDSVLNEVISAVNKTLVGKIHFNEKLAKYTSWRVGGPADQYYRPSDINDLAVFLNQLDLNQPVFWLGGGSNLLIRDGGIRGTVIHLRRTLGKIKLEDDGRLYVEAGVSCPQVARFCQKNKLSGASFLVGIPGSVGGALAMNAGAFGGETWELVSEVELIDRQGNRQWIQSSAINTGYRQVEIPEQHWFVAARLSLPATGYGDDEIIQELLERRRQSQPINVPTCGSVFKNPDEGFAAQLIERCGLKGHQIGKARVSDKHANFIENLGGATALEIELLINLIRDRVEQEQSVLLESEVCIVGEAVTHEH
ncbi:MAG: UDP-N-acetylmuramate dehydrogenase [Gammaproteobacteria bacterium]|nr:UDP-N-acetylmuramate dehydrogenase [Gammaproteobacteria bacterium]